MSDVIHREIARGNLGYPYGKASTNEEVLSAVMNALHHNSGVPSDHIRVEVTDGRVVLSGSVMEDYERTLAEQAATAVPGVTKVDNQIKIGR